MKKYKFTYENSGVNINAADNFVKYIANLENKKKSRFDNNNIGSFASITSMPKGIKEPLLVWRGPYNEQITESSLIGWR